MSDGLANGLVRRRQLWSIQYLRGLAALMVVVFHARDARPWLYNPWESFTLGAHGVDIFFVISGFIMFTAARGEGAFEFVARRVIRVMPLYWLATLVLLGIMFIQGEGFSRLTLLRSLLLIPTPSPSNPAEVWPMLIPGWTLIYEMLFYAVFAVGLLTKRLVPVVVISIIGLCVLGQVFQFEGPILRTYTSMRLIMFLAGFLVAIAFQRSGFRWAAALLPVGVIAMIGASAQAHIPIIWWTAIATAIVVGALGCESRGWVGHSPAFKLLGDASYSLYLSHTLVMTGVDAIFKPLPLSGITQFLSLFAVTMVATLSVGILVYWYIEQPLLKLLIPRRDKARG